MASLMSNQDRPHQSVKETTNFFSLPLELRQQILLDAVRGSIRLHWAVTHEFEADRPGSGTGRFHLNRLYWVATNPANELIEMLASTHPRLDDDLAWVKENYQKGMYGGGHEAGDVEKTAVPQ